MWSKQLEIHVQLVINERRQPPSLDPEKVKELFQQLDANGDGSVDVKELREGLRRMGVPTIPLWAN